MGKKHQKQIGPKAHPPSSFKLRGGGGNMNPYAKIADKGLINPLMETDTEKTPKNPRQMERRARRKARTGSEKLRIGAGIVSGAGLVFAALKTASQARQGTPLSGPLAGLFK